MFVCAFPSAVHSMLSSENPTVSQFYEDMKHRDEYLKSQFASMVSIQKEFLEESDPYPGYVRSFTNEDYYKSLWSSRETGDFMYKVYDDNKNSIIPSDVLPGITDIHYLSYINRLSQIFGVNYSGEPSMIGNPGDIISYEFLENETKQYKNYAWDPQNNEWSAEFFDNFISPVLSRQMDNLISKMKAKNEFLIGLRPFMMAANYLPSFKINRDLSLFLNPTNTTYFNMTLHNRDMKGGISNKFVKISKAINGDKTPREEKEDIQQGQAKKPALIGEAYRFELHTTGITDSDGYVTFNHLPVNGGESKNSTQPSTSNTDSVELIRTRSYIYLFEVFDTSDDTGTVVWSETFGGEGVKNDITFERPLPSLLNVSLTILDGDENPISGVTVELLPNGRELDQIAGLPTHFTNTTKFGLDQIDLGQVESTRKSFGTFTTDENGMISVDGIEIPTDSPELRWNLTKSGYELPSPSLEVLSFSLGMMRGAIGENGIVTYEFTETYHLNEIQPLTLRTTAQPEELLQAGIGTSTGYIKVNYWDETSEILGQGSTYPTNPMAAIGLNSIIQINKTIDVNDTYSDRTMSIYSCDVDGNITGSIIYVETLSLNFDSIDVTSCRELYFLYINHTQITSLDLSNSTNLFRLSCDGTPISSLDITGLNNLWGLYCDDTNLDSSDNDSLLDLLSSRYNRNDGLMTLTPIGADRVFNSNTGRTSASDTSYNTLLTQGWTINGETINTACDSTIAGVLVTFSSDRPQTLDVVGDFNLKPSYSFADGELTIMYSGEFWYLMGDYGSTELAIATSGNEDYPWLATWPGGYTITKQCPMPQITTTTTTEEPTTTTTTTQSSGYYSYDFTSKVQRVLNGDNSLGDILAKKGVTDWDGTQRFVASDLNTGTQVYYIGTDGNKHFISFDTSISNDGVTNQQTSQPYNYLEIIDGVITGIFGDGVTFDSITPFN